MALGKKTGGRQKGTPNKATAAKAEAIAASGLTPLDYMLQVMRDEDVERHARFAAAKAAAPYVHPHLAAVTHTGPDGGPIQTEDVSVTDVARRVAFLLTAAKPKD